MFFRRFLKLVYASFLIGSISPIFAIKTPQTYITLNAEKGCSVRVGAWLSPSCTHCAEYFNKIMPKLTEKIGFCIDFHSLPHLYPLDMSVAILVWSQGPENAVKNAMLFYAKQDEWLIPSVNNSDVNDDARKDDVTKFLKEMEALQPSNIARIKQYINPQDPALYVKLFALRNGFSIEHMDKFLSHSGFDADISRALVMDLPRSAGKNGEPEVVKYSPAFTDEKGDLIPDDVLDRKILTEDTADEMLKKAGPPIPLKAYTPPPLPEFPYASEPPQKKPRTEAKKAEIIPDDVEDDVQDVDEDEELDEGLSDVDFEADFTEEDEDDGLQNMSSALKEVLAQVS